MYEPITPRRVFEYLSAHDLESVHRATLRLMEQVGLEFGSLEARRILADVGCDVEEEKRRVRFPSRVVEKAIGLAPPEILLAARDPERDVLLGGGRVHYGPGTGSAMIIDLDTGQRRMGTRKDAADMARLIDALPHIRFFKNTINPCDVDPKMGERVLVAEALANTTKPVCSSCFSAEGCRDVIRMGIAVAGSEQAYRSRPLTAVSMTAVSPLVWPEYSADQIILSARAGAPHIVATAPQAGTTAPVTLAGLIVQQNAETLAGVVLSQAAAPGSPVLLGAVGTVADLRTGRYASGAVELAMTNAVHIQLSRKYRIPLYASGGKSDSKLGDYQCGVEKSLQALLVGLSGGEYIHHAAGMFEGDISVDPVLFVLDDEMLGAVERILAGIDVSGLDSALEAIKRVGPGGHFLEDDHTFRHMRTEHYLPGIWDRQDRESWAISGGLDAYARAREKTRKILDIHHPEPLPTSASKAIERILKEAEASLRASNSPKH